MSPRKRRPAETDLGRVAWLHPLRYVGPGTFRGVPARDLTSEDLARLAYRRSMTVTGADGVRPDPSKPDARVLRKIVAELTGSGLYKPEV